MLLIPQDETSMAHVTIGQVPAGMLPRRGRDRGADCSVP
jgi:hypothetical protein